MLVDEFSMAGANLLLPKAADAVASLTMTTIAMPDAMPLAMAAAIAAAMAAVLSDIAGFDALGGDALLHDL